MDRLTLNDGRVAAVNDDCEWESEDAKLLADLESRFPITDYPADGIIGRRSILEAAKELDGVVEFGPEEPDDPNVIY